MKDWLEQNREKVMYGLVIIVLLLMIAIFSTRDTMSKRISGLNEEKWALEEAAAAKDKELAELRAKEGESKTEIAKLGAANGEMAGRITSLDLAMSDARLETGRLDLIVSLRQKTVENLRNEIGGLKRSEAESGERISRLLEENAAAEAKIARLNETLISLRGAESPEAALPAVPDADSTVAIKISDASSLASAASGLSKTIKELSKLNPNAREAEGVISAMEFLAGFAGTAGELSLLVTPSEDPGIYMAFLADGDAFDKFMSRPHGTFYAQYKFDEWSDGNEGKGWTFSASRGATPDLYIKKIPAGARSLVLIARHKEEIASMTETASGSSPRFEAGRMTSGADYYQIKFKDGFKVGDILDAFSFDENLRSSMREIMGDADRVLWTVTECSWTRDGDTVNFESYSDIFKLNPQLAASRRTGGGPIAIMGEGDLAYFVSVDTGVLMSYLFLGSGDPAGKLIEIMGGRGGLAPISDDDVREILTNSTLSVVCAADGGKISTAYLELDTDSPGTADKLFSLAHG
ncbi:MAG: hypothetical protein LBU26_03125, partial [Synergistaceae bacterium]|nr:hypothetical protein [Synergistaceae bacterium]